MKPIYPEILTPEFTLSVSGVNNGDGTATISIAEGQEFLIQDVKVNTTGRTDLSFTVPIPTTAGQVDTYHLRYSLNGKAINSYIPNKNSFYFVNVMDTNYNPSGVSEEDPQFDTTYDDMLVAKIEIDDAGNITITSLKNRQKLTSNTRVDAKINSTPNDTYPPTVNIEVSINWSRKPFVSRGGIYNEYVHAVNDISSERSSLIIPELTNRYIVRASHTYEIIANSTDGVSMILYMEA